MTEIPAGWYDDGHGRKRWWDGSAWTNTLQNQLPPESKSSTEVVILPPVTETAVADRPKYGELIASRATAALDGAPDRIIGALRTQYDFVDDPDAIWSAVGRPITGIGAGRYKLTAQMLFFEKGTLSTRAQQIGTHEIHDVDVVQTMTQKARGLGTIRIRARRAGGAEEVIELADIPNFREGVAALNRAAQSERERRQLRDKTTHQNVNYSGGTPLHNIIVPEPAPTPAAPGRTLNEELATLAEFRDKGILDEDEFLAAKRKLLGI
jgi:hypothetical protein